MKGHRMNKIRGLAAGFLTVAILTGGCARQTPPAELSTDQSVPTETVDPEAEGERLAVLKAAAERRDGYRWPRETVQKDILGRETEFVLYHGNGWTIHVPASWEEEDVGQWKSPSHSAGFQVDKLFLGVNNPKFYRAQQGSWRHETSYDPPFDYYYDNDGGYIPPDGSADYIYFFAPDGEDRSYEFTLDTVVGETTEEERAIQEAMLLSFCLDDSSRVLCTGEYTPGQTEWEAALAGLLAEAEPIWFHLERSDGVWSDIVNGKGSPDYLSHALALEDYRAGEFVQTFFGERPEGAPESGREMITLCLPEMKIWLYFYSSSPWVCVHHAGEDYWAEFRHKDGPDKLIFDAVYSWLEAESEWVSGEGSEKSQI